MKPILLLLGLATVAELPWSSARRAPMHKVQLTQKGYIQFLRWEVPVPEISEFTFCLWVESEDLTHPHPIFSYSRNERERLVRAWIAGRGTSIRVEIAGRPVFSARTNLRENRWYHVCVSWENRLGRYGFWLNGQLRADGIERKTAGYVIPGGGDVVVGQEYTDFDKGLDDGIEGSVLGFNLLLVSGFEPLGALLRELSYARCAVGRGSPLAAGRRLLPISWARTPVRVFGGATLENVRDECGNF